MLFQTLIERKEKKGASAFFSSREAKLPSPFFYKEGGNITDNIKHLPNEEWREIKGYGGKYLVSNKGRIKSLKHRKPKLLTAFVNNKGYARVALCKDG